MVRFRRLLADFGVQMQNVLLRPINGWIHTRPYVQEFLVGLATWELALAQ